MWLRSLIPPLCHQKKECCFCDALCAWEVWFLPSALLGGWVTSAAIFPIARVPAPHPDRMAREPAWPRWDARARLAPSKQMGAPFRGLGSPTCPPANPRQQHPPPHTPPPPSSAHVEAWQCGPGTSVIASLQYNSMASPPLPSAWAPCSGCRAVVGV